MTQTQPAIRWVPGSYDSGLVHGRINYLFDTQTGVSWWLDRNQWRYWDGQHWVFANLRTRNVHSNTVAGLVMALIFVLAGSAIGGPSLYGLLFLASASAALGVWNDHMANNHPRAYQVISVVSAAMGAEAIYGLAHKVRGPR